MLEDGEALRPGLGPLFVLIATMTPRTMAAISTSAIGAIEYRSQT